jgi:hypothetical protein
VTLPRAMPTTTHSWLPPIATTADTDPRPWRSAAIFTGAYGLRPTLLPQNGPGQSPGSSAPCPAQIVDVPNESFDPSDGVSARSEIKLGKRPWEVSPAAPRTPRLTHSGPNRSRWHLDIL